MVSYKPLWHILVDRGLTKKDLSQIANISVNTMTKLRKNEEVSMTILNKICSSLGVGYGDIIEFIPNEREDNR